MAAGPGAEPAGARPAAAAARDRGRLLGALPAARRALAAAGAQGLPDRQLRHAAGAAPRLGHQLLPEVPSPENTARCGWNKSTDIPRGQDFRDWRDHATPERRSPRAPLMARSRFPPWVNTARAAPALSLL